MTSTSMQNAPEGLLLSGERHEERPRLSNPSGRLVESVALLPSPGVNRLVWVYVTRSLSALHSTPTERRIRRHIVHASLAQQAALLALNSQQINQGLEDATWVLRSR